MQAIQTIDTLDLTFVIGGMGRGGGTPPRTTPRPATTAAPTTPADPRYEPAHTTGGDACRAAYTGAGAAIGAGLASETGPGAILGAAGGAFLGDFLGSKLCPP